VSLAQGRSLARDPNLISTLFEVLTLSKDLVEFAF
jgi:hypothetical protein